MVLPAAPIDNVERYVTDDYLLVVLDQSAFLERRESSIFGVWVESFNRGLPMVGTVTKQDERRGGFRSAAQRPVRCQS